MTPAAALAQLRALQKEIAFVSQAKDPGVGGEDWVVVSRAMQRWAVELAELSAVLAALGEPPAPLEVVARGLANTLPDGVLDALRVIKHWRDAVYVPGTPPHPRKKSGK